jgi:hypothetical protein
MEQKNQIQTTKPQETQLAKQSPNSLIEYVKTNEEKDIVRACEDVRVSEITKADAERLIEVVGKWGFYMGTSNRLSSEDILVICKFIRETYGQLRINEINLAINLNLKGSLGNHEYFGHLSPLYISGVLNSYIDYKSEMLKPLLQRREKESYTAPPPLTQSEQYEMICTALRSQYNNFQKGKDIVDAFSIIYDFLEKSGRITITPELDELATNYALKFIPKPKSGNPTAIGEIEPISITKMNEGKQQYNNYILYNLFSTINDIEEYIRGININEFS